MLYTEIDVAHRELWKNNERSRHVIEKLKEFLTIFVKSDVITAASR
jgi:hypothetical protein